RRMDYGEKILPPYYELNVPSWNKIALVELPIKNIEIAGVPVKGNLDKVEFVGKQVTVVDYKTGNLKYAKEKFTRPDDNNPNGADYWRQAVFYRLLIDSDKGKDWQVVNTVFDFVEPINANEYHKEYVNITADDITLVTEQIRTVYQKIMAHDFNTGCGKEDCEWCHFVRSNFTQPGNILELAGGAEE
ncbi:MAG: PD-(D/E)XK nuclease family protein, partial [Mucilaginibacter sp.]